MTASAAERALVRRLRALERDLPAVLDDDVEALHHSRVASRRLREILPVLGLDLSQGRQSPVRKLRRRLRRTTSALGEVRELDVALGILDALGREHPDLADVLAAARLGVETDRRRCRDEMARQLGDLETGDLLDALARLADEVARASQATRLLLLRQRLTRRTDRLERAMADAGSLFVLDRLHRVRIAAKQLRYTLELVHEVGRVPTRRLVARLRRFQDLLGRLHDLEVVAGYVHPAHGAGGRRGGEPAERAMDLLEREMRELHAAYLGGVGTLEGVIAACRLDVERRLAGGAAMVSVRRGAS